MLKYSGLYVYLNKGKISLLILIKGGSDRENMVNWSAVISQRYRQCFRLKQIKVHIIIRRSFTTNSAAFLAASQSLQVELQVKESQGRYSQQTEKIFSHVSNMRDGFAQEIADAQYDKGTPAER